MTAMTEIKTQRSQAPFVSVVLPVYNESSVLRRLVGQIKRSLQHETGQLEIIFVNDGSTDGSATLLDNLATSCPDVCVVHFSRNYGHQAAVQAGLEQARGDAIIVMDSDLQDDPDALSQFLDAWKQGYDIVYATRTQRKEAVWKRSLFTAFYRILNAISSVSIPRDAGNFSLIDRRVLDQLNQLPERDRYFPGLRSWVGFRQIGIEVERLARYDDQPRVSLLGLFRLAKTAIFSFSSIPLTMFYLIGGVSFLMSLSLAGFALYHKLITGLAIPGWTSSTMVISLFGAINALGIAILGEYAARIYDQVRARPNYLISRVNGFESLQNSTLADKQTQQYIPTDSPEAELLQWLAENISTSPWISKQSEKKEAVPVDAI